MAFTAEERREAARRWARRCYHELGETATLDRDDIFAAVDAVDAWVADNQASFNAALPQPFKGTATVQQKAILLSMVALVKTGAL